MCREGQVRAAVVIATHCELVRTLQVRKPPHSASITPVSPYKQTEPTRNKTSLILAKATFQCALARFELWFIVYYYILFKKSNTSVISKYIVNFL